MSPLGTVVLSVASWVVGFFSALARDWLLRRRHLQKITRTLMTEVCRLREELGPEGGFVDVEMFGSASAVPEVHPWIERQVAEAAEIDAEIVTHFLRLDRYLNNLRTFRRKLPELRKHAEETEKEAKASFRALVEATEGSAVPIPELVAPYKADEAKHNLELLEHSCDDMHKRAHQELNEIGRLLKGRL